MRTVRRSAAPTSAPFTRLALLLRAVLFMSALGAGAAVLAAPAAAQTVQHPTIEHVVYGGLGNQGTQTTVPWSIGYLWVPQSSHMTLGMDFSGEGTSRDNTTGNYDTPGQAWSWNALVGAHWRHGDWVVGVSPLVGMRTTNKSCPSGSSYLGYQCYADENPAYDFAVNVGAVAHLSYRRFVLGARQTSASAQVLVGIGL